MLKTPIAILIALVTLLGGFYGGYRLGNGSSASAASSSNGGSGSGSRGNFAAGGGLAAFCAAPSPGASGSAQGRGAGRGATGTITFLSGGSMTVHNPACNTDVKVTFDPTVVVRKTVVGGVSDLQENENVTVTGQRQADGSVKATSITLVPAGSFRFGAAGGAGGSGSAGAGVGSGG
jgi:hypothetical protein